MEVIYDPVIFGDVQNGWITVHLNSVKKLHAWAEKISAGFVMDLLQCSVLVKNNPLPQDKEILVMISINLC